MRSLEIQSILVVAAVGLVLGPATRTPADDLFQSTVAPFTAKYCVECHRGEDAKGGLDLANYRHVAEVLEDFRQWNHIVEFVRGGEMPPEKSPQPRLEEREQMAAAVEQILLTEARKRDGDPGAIPPRRLSNTEYDHSIRDLTGIDIRPTRDFPADPAGGEGFDNTGEALRMSPNLLKKYLAAAQEVSTHLVLKTDGVTFAPHPVTSYNERKKLTEHAIIEFYRQHDVDIQEYLTAAWTYRHRKQSVPDVSLAEWAAERRLSARYLRRVWDTLHDDEPQHGYLKQLRQRWEALPAPVANAERSPELAELTSFIVFCQKQLFERDERLIRPNAGTWPIGQLAMRAEKAAQRDRFRPEVLKSQTTLRLAPLRMPSDSGDPVEASFRIRVDDAFAARGERYVVFHRPILSKQSRRPRNDAETHKDNAVTLREFLTEHAPDLASRLRFGVHPAGGELDGDSFVLKSPAALELTFSQELLQRANGRRILVDCSLDTKQKAGGVHVQGAIDRPLDAPWRKDAELLIHLPDDDSSHWRASCQRFCETFPNRFAYVDPDRGLAAGFHLVEGFFRDDQPLVEKVLDADQRETLDQLWQELSFVTQSTETLLRGFVWFERSERHVLHDERFDFLRPEDPKLVSESMLTRFEREYLDKLNVKLAADAIKPVSPSKQFDVIHGFFQQIREGLKTHERLMKAAEKRGLADLEDLASRAYRRPLEASDRRSLTTLYQRLRGQGQSVEESLRGVFTAILMSPDFCYCIPDTPPGDSVHPLDDASLASRLSYFLWSSLPDDELLEFAEQGLLNTDAALRAQTRRMVKSDKVRALAREFLGQWLRYRDYLSKDPINAATFRDYDDALRQAMFEEPTHFATHMIREDLPITALLTSDATFVNGVLARHYGGEIEAQYRRQRAIQSGSQGQSERASSRQAEDPWYRVEGLRASGRGGLFGMGVILTKNSAGERTSPVKRGFWAVHHLLGKHFPPPPTDVPELPPGEKEAKRTIRELIAEHTAHAKCAICHTHFDSLGLAMEGFNPIGKARDRDLAGRPIDNLATLPNGKQAQGVPGLIEYVARERKGDFAKTFCRKFLGYALGRSVMLSDQPLLERMEAALKANDYRFSSVVETVVLSPQFRTQRGRDYSVSTNKAAPSP